MLFGRGIMGRIVSGGRKSITDSVPGIFSEGGEDWRGAGFGSGAARNGGKSGGPKRKEGMDDLWPIFPERNAVE